MSDLVSRQSFIKDDRNFFAGNLMLELKHRHKDWKWIKDEYVHEKGKTTYVMHSQ